MTFSAKKSLGQHFLHAPNVVGAMVHAAGLEPGAKILEIGPGKGVLTKGLLAAGAQVTAIELDERAIDHMKAEFADFVASGQLILVSGDILETDPSQLGLEKGKYAVIANIPYYITGEIIRKFLTAENHPNSMVLLVQKEVAKRIAAKDGKESVLSISVKSYGNPKYVVSVPKRAFRPVPNVDSAVISIQDIGKSFFGKEEIVESDFFAIVKAGFAHKRKILKGNLTSIMSREQVDNLWTEEKWNADLRAESMTLDQWKKIALFHRNHAK